MTQPQEPEVLKDLEPDMERVRTAATALSAAVCDLYVKAHGKQRPEKVNLLEALFPLRDPDDAAERDLNIACISQVSASLMRIAEEGKYARWEKRRSARIRASSRSKIFKL